MDMRKRVCASACTCCVGLAKFSDGCSNSGGFSFSQKRPMCVLGEHGWAETKLVISALFESMRDSGLD